MPAMKFRAELLLERGMKGQSLRHAHRAFLLDDEEKDRAVALMRRVEAGVQVSMSYCINRAVSIS